MLVRRSSDPSQLSSPRMHMIDPSPRTKSPETPIAKKLIGRSLSSSSTPQTPTFEAGLNNNEDENVNIKPGHFRSQSRFQGRFEVMDLDQMQSNLTALQESLSTEGSVLTNSNCDSKNKIMGRFHVLDLGTSPPLAEQDFKRRMCSAEDANSMEENMELQKKNAVPIACSSVMGRFEVVDIHSSGLTPPLEEPPVFSSCLNKRDSSPSRMVSSHSLPNLAASSSLPVPKVVLEEACPSSRFDLEAISTVELMAELNRRLIKVMQENESLKKEISRLERINSK
jgi:hypothetical protein